MEKKVSFENSKTFLFINIVFKELVVENGKKEKFIEIPNHKHMGLLWPTVVGVCK